MANLANLQGLWKVFSDLWLPELNMSLTLNSPPSPPTLRDKNDTNIYKSEIYADLNAEYIQAEVMIKLTKSYKT